MLRHIAIIASLILFQDLFAQDTGQSQESEFSLPIEVFAKIAQDTNSRLAVFNLNSTTNQFDRDSVELDFGTRARIGFTAHQKISGVPAYGLLLLEFSKTRYLLQGSGESEFSHSRTKFSENHLAIGIGARWEFLFAETMLTWPLGTYHWSKLDGSLSEDGTPQTGFGLGVGITFQGFSLELYGRWLSWGFDFSEEAEALAVSFGWSAGYSIKI